MRTGFTYIEVLAGVLILVVGIFSVLGLVIYGLRLATRAQAQAQGMSTALTVAVDPAPLAASGDWTSTNWTRAGDNIKSNGDITCTTNGWINGLYVVREETSTTDDIVAGGDPASPSNAPSMSTGMRSAQVVVRVYDAIGGIPVAGVTTRIVRQHTASYTP